MERLSSIHEQYTEEDEIKKHAQVILSDLGLTLEDLRDKKVLDLGAGGAELAKVAKKDGIDIVSMDLQMLKDNKEGINYVVGDVNNAPFNNESFDLIIAHAAPPLIMVKNAIDVKVIIEEVKRLLKNNGEFRFGPIGIVFDDEKLFTDEEEESFSTEQRVERVNKKSLELLQSIDPTISEDRSSADGYYSLKKAL